MAVQPPLLSLSQMSFRWLYARFEFIECQSIWLMVEVYAEVETSFLDLNPLFEHATSLILNRSFTETQKRGTMTCGAG